MIELGLKLTCDFCLRSEVEWVDPPNRGRIQLVIAVQDLVVRLVRGATGWCKVRQRGGGGLEVCPECRARLGLVAVPVETAQVG